MAKTTDELFAEATEADYETAEPVTLAASDTEEEFQFRIDEHLRTIAIPEKGVVAGVEGDLNVNIARFTMTRYYHGRDLSKLNIRINYRNANGQVNYYTVSDATVSGDSIVFSWEFAADVTQYKGNVQFVVYLFSATNAVLKQRFFTTLGTLEVLEGLEVDSSIPVSEQTDILLHLKKDLSAYAEEVKKSLPADYTAMTEQVNSLKEDLSHYEKYENVEKSYYEGVLCKNGRIENRNDWHVSYPIDLNGIKCVRVKGTFNNLAASSNYTHIVFYDMPDVSPDGFISYISLAETEVKEIDILIDVPKSANYMCICDSSTYYNNTSIDVYYNEQYMKDNRRHNIVSDYMDLNYESNEITMYYKNGNLIFNGSSNSNTTLLVYSSMNGFLLENGETYIVDFIPENSTEKSHIQIFANNTSIPLVNGRCYNSYSFTVPNDAEDVFVRFILFSGNHINESYKFSIRKKNNEYSKLYISNANELYNFLKNPIPYTHLILESTTYDIYTGLFENDIVKNEQFKHESYLHDIIIDGNNSTISFIIASTVLEEKPAICNTYSCINVKGNITVNDVTLIGKNCRYTLHEESLDEFLWFNTKHKYNNCTIIYEGNDFNTVNANTIGCGFSKNQNIEFNECDIINNTEHAEAFYVHTRDFNISNLSFDNCTFNLRDNAFSIMLSQYTGNGKKCPVHINNSIIGKVEFLTQNNGLNNNQWSLKAINSFITQLYVDDSTTLLFKPKKVNTIDGTIEY